MTRKNVGIASALVAGTVGAGFAALKLVVRADRRRVGMSPAELESVISTPSSFSLPADCRQSTVKRADGTSIHVVERGNPTAPPVVLLHGVTLAASIWRHQFEDLVADYRVIAIDWRGHGASTVGTDGYGLAPLADDLHAVLEQLDLKGAVLVGHSMGGMAIMSFCRLHANTLYRRVNGLVFQSTAASQVAGPAAPLARLVAAASARNPRLVGKIAQLPSGDLGYVGVRLGFGKHPNPVDIEQVRQLWEAMNPESLAGSVAGLLSHDEERTLAGLDLPVLVLVGTHDLATPLDQATTIVNKTPGADIHIFPDAGHTLMLERREELAEVLRTFAAKCQPRKRSGSTSAIERSEAESPEPNH